MSLRQEAADIWGMSNTSTATASRSRLVRVRPDDDLPELQRRLEAFLLIAQRVSTPAAARSW